MCQYAIKIAETMRVEDVHESTSEQAKALLASINALSLIPPDNGFIAVEQLDKPGTISI
jgi:hypothetical protein